MQASLKRIDVRQVSRYLPTALSENVRHYLRDALRQGSADNLKLRVRGPLEQFPFNQPQQGEFRLTAQLNRVTYAYVPGSSPGATAAMPTDWPAMTDLNGERLSFGRATGRHFGKWVSALTLGIGYLMCLFTARKQCLHDLMAGCLMQRKA